MPPISRRRALQLGALGAAGMLVGAVGLSRTGLPPLPGAGQAVGEALREPELLGSDGGGLRTELVVTRQEVELAGRRATVLAYNGTVPGPTWRVRPGDLLQVRLTNRTDTPTNLHTHGLHVSPEGSGDNPFLSIEPGQSFDYEFQLPADHPTGTFWYHPHRHGLVADQLHGGLYGGIVVDEQSPVNRERLLIVSDISLRADGTVRSASRPETMMGREGDTVMVNGQVRPTLTARPGERERWRIINACTSRFLRLALPGQRLRLLAVDTGRHPRIPEVGDVLLAPGNRADLLIDARPGTSVLRTIGYDRGRMTGMMRGGPLSGAFDLATYRVTGTPTDGPGPLPEPDRPADLRDAAPTRHREIEFTVGMGMGMGMGGTFGFDGRSFDHERTDQQVRTGTVEEWTIRNPSPMDHPFHLHVWPMQVIDDNGRAPAEPSWRDVVNVPAGGRVTVRIAFDTFSGRSVYHCHILDHEDLGMMATVEAT